MAGWQTELIVMLRHVIGDLDCPQTYTNSRLEQVLLVAAQMVNSDIDSETDYTVDIDSEILSPDPTSTRDDQFINLMILKAACILGRGLLRTSASREGIRIRDQMGEIEVKGGFAAQKDMAKTFCDAYEQAKLEYALGNFANIKAIFNVVTGPNIDTDYLGPNDRGLFR